MAKRRKAKSFASNDIEAYLHEMDKRKNAVPVGLVSYDTSKPKSKKYEYNPHLDPQRTRTELINPVLFDWGWVDAFIREEKTPGGVDIIDGKPRKRKGRTDYLLCIPVIDGKPPLPIALLEAKAEGKRLHEKV